METSLEGRGGFCIPERPSHLSPPEALCLIRQNRGLAMKTCT